MKIMSSLQALFFPHYCAGCGTDLPQQGQILCIRCVEGLPITDFHCHANNPVRRIFDGRMQVEQAMAYLFFTKQSVLQHLLHQLKYRGQREIGRYLGRRMGEALQSTLLYSDIDLIIPLPLHASRQLTRGYNQAELIAAGMTEVTRWPLLTTAVKRGIATSSQTKKNRIERWKNMQHGFFVADGHRIKGKHVLLVDDVITTGATLEACGEQLLRVEGLRLSIAALAYAAK